MDYRLADKDGTPHSLHAVLDSMALQIGVAQHVLSAMDNQHMDTYRAKLHSQLSDATTSLERLAAEAGLIVENGKRNGER
jgi:hypothetical protein